MPLNLVKNPCFVSPTITLFENEKEEEEMIALHPGSIHPSRIITMGTPDPSQLIAMYDVARNKIQVNFFSSLPQITIALALTWPFHTVTVFYSPPSSHKNFPTIYPYTCIVKHTHTDIYIVLYIRIHS